MELIAQKTLYRGYGQAIEPGQRFEETRQREALELVRSGKATYAAYEANPAAATLSIGLVSCIMPTRNRRTFIPRAIQCFLGQTYEPKELIVLDNGDPIADLLPKDARIRYMRLNSSQTTGQLRNLCCQLAHGEYIAHWDDDDWSHPWRLEEQVAAIGAKGVTGYQKILFHGPNPGDLMQYSGGHQYAVGASLLYRRDWWERNRFPSQQVGEDADFVMRARGNIVVTDGTARMVAGTHAGNTSPRLTKNQEWAKVEVSKLPEGYSA